MKTFEEADRLARKTLGAGWSGMERVCDCIGWLGKPAQPAPGPDQGGWVVNGCDCGNYDDARSAQDWCATENAVAKVRNLIQELTK